MPKIVALDIGLKRTGIAITDDLQIIASGLTTVATEELMAYLKKLMTKEEIEEFVLGNPVNLDGSTTDGTNVVKKVSHQLQNEFPTLQISFVDERFTSSIAKQAILASGASKKQRRDKALVDKVSAVLILQTYLERKQS